MKRNVWLVVTMILLYLDWMDFCQLWLVMPDAHRLLLECLTDKQMRKIFYYNTKIVTIYEHAPELFEWLDPSGKKPSCSNLNPSFFRNSDLTVQKLATAYRELSNTFLTRDTIAVLNTVSTGGTAKYEFNPIYNIIAMSWWYRTGAEETHWCMRVESYKDVKNHKIIYENLSTSSVEAPYVSGTNMSWSPDGMHLLYASYQKPEKGLFAEIKLFRYFPRRACMKMLIIDGQKDNSFLSERHLPSKHLWISRNTFILLHSNNRYQRVTVTPKRIIVSTELLMNLDFPILSDNIYGCYVALPEINALAFVEDCCRGESNKKK